MLQHAHTFIKIGNLPSGLYSEPVHSRAILIIALTLPCFETLRSCFQTLDRGPYTVWEVYHGKTTVLSQETLVLARPDHIVEDMHSVVCKAMWIS